MNQGFLSQYFVSVAAKKLSAVETDLERSHQHEFNGSSELKRVLGTGTGERVTFETRFIWFGGENEGIVSDGSVTWYDSRLNHPTRSEYRLYFPSNEVMSLAQEGDSLFIARRTDDTLLLIITASGTTLENQLHWLFGLSKQENFNFSLQEFVEEDDVEVDFTVRFILDELGIDIEEPETDRLDDLLQQFGTVFPSTREFSEFARNNLNIEVNSIEEPDTTLMAWLEFEESLFRRLERHIVAERIEKGFVDNEETDVDGFIKFSLSVQNRRKSRAGLSLENHLEPILLSHSISYERGAKTENNSSPDFLFPGSAEYHNPAYTEKLAMLGVKTSCKDRWRQVLSEAKRIENKHLLTLEPGITESQTDEMKFHNLQLVLPKKIHETYSDMQKSWLFSLSDFLSYLKEK